MKCVFASVIVARPAIILSLVSGPQVDAGAGGTWGQWDQDGPRAKLTPQIFSTYIEAVALVGSKIQPLVLAKVLIDYPVDGKRVAKANMAKGQVRRLNIASGYEANMTTPCEMEIFNFLWLI